MNEMKIAAMKVAAKRAARFNLWVMAVVAIFSLWAIAKAQSDKMPERPYSIETSRGAAPLGHW